MALIKCKECGNDVSDKAKTCPKCGAKVTRPSVFLYLLGFLVVGFGVMMLIGMSDPKGAEKSQARRAIEICWQEHERKSLAPADKRFIASACEKMERDFTSLFGVRP